MILEVHEILEPHSLSGNGQFWPGKMALHRMFTAEDVLSFKQGQRGFADAIQTLEIDIGAVLRNLSISIRLPYQCSCFNKLISVSSSHD